MTRCLPAEGSQDHFHIGVELGEHLTAGPAGWGGFGSVRSNDNLGELPATRRDRSKDRIALGTDGQAEAHILHIAPRKSPPIRPDQHGPNMKAGVGSISTPRHLNRLHNQLMLSVLHIKY